MEDLPQSVARFVGELETRGFVRTADHGDKASFGNRLLVLRRTPVEIRVFKDRGQWTADMTADGWADGDRVHFPVFHGFALPGS